jgi:hypothetical protein
MEMVDPGRNRATACGDNNYRDSLDWCALDQRAKLPKCQPMPLTEGRVKRRFRLVIPWVSDVFLLQLFDKRSPTPKTPKKPGDFNKLADLRPLQLLALSAN